MRRGIALSALLHLAVLGWLFHGLAQAGGAPTLGEGGAGFEMVMVASAAGGSEAASAAPPASKPGPEAELYLAAAAQARLTPEPPTPNPLSTATEGPPVPLGEEAMVPPTAALAPAEPPSPEPAPEQPRPPEEADVEQPDETTGEPADDVSAPPPKPTKAVTLPEPVKQAAPVKERSAAKQQQAEAEPSEAGATDTELASLPSPGTGSAATAQGDSNDPGTPGSLQVGVSSGELQDYGQLLLAWLDRHKRYPDQARKRRQEGVVTVELAIDGQGHLVSHRIVAVSGVAALDDEARALLERASPFPIPPGGGTHAFQVPIVFALR